MADDGIGKMRSQAGVCTQMPMTFSMHNQVARQGAHKRFFKECTNVAAHPRTGSQGSSPLVRRATDLHLSDKTYAISVQILHVVVHVGAILPHLRTSGNIIGSKKRESCGTIGVGVMTASAGSTATHHVSRY